jgi:uncharacterized protein (DUF433 family)
MKVDIIERIQIDPNIHFGRPCAVGTRIPVMDVLELIREGFSFEQIMRDYYPDLQIDDLRACVQYAMESDGIRRSPRDRSAMKLLLDQDVYAATARFLRDSGHDVITASDIVLTSYSGVELLKAFVVVEPGRHRFRKLPGQEREYQS